MSRSRYQFFGGGGGIIIIVIWMQVLPLSSQSQKDGVLIPKPEKIQMNSEAKEFWDQDAQNCFF